jgi:tripartite-type tricarboxylate transporter receptor subunit TctC
MSYRKLKGAAGWIAGAAIGLLLAAQSATAQDYPSRTITLVVPFAAGSANDTFGRLIAEGLQERFGQPVVVENLPGAGGLLGAAQVAQAAPDGYTLMSHSNSLVSGQVMRQNPEFDFRKAFVAIAQYGYSPAALTIFKDLPVNSTPELIEYSKSNPVNYGTAGVGSITHLYIEWFKQVSGLQAEHVPFGGGALAQTAMIGGEIQMLLSDIGVTRALVEEGQIRRLSVAAEERSPLAPDTPTMKEEGIDFEFLVRYGLFAPAGTPDEIVRVLNEEVNKIVSTGRFKEILEGGGGHYVNGTPEDFAAIFATELEELSAVVDSAGIPRE